MKADSSTVRIINRKSIIDAIYNNDGVSKTALATRLNLSKPSISRNVADLIAMGIVKEMGEGESTKHGGKKPTKLCFNGSYRYIAALELSTKQPACAVGDLNCNMLRLVKIDVSRDDSADVKKQRIVHAFSRMLESSGIPLEKLELIVISQPGQIGMFNTVLYVDAMHHPWTNIGLQAHLEAHFKIPVMLKNDVRMAALGEMNMGDGKQYQSLIYVSCGIGLGSCIIYKRQLFEGDRHAAGELGAFLMPDGKRVEEIVSMDALLKRISNIYMNNNIKAEALDFEEVVKKSLSGDAYVNQGLREIGSILGRVVYNYCVMLDISTVILGGDYVRLGSALLEGMESEVKQTFLPINITIQKSSLREAAGIFGCFVVAKDAILQSKVYS